MGIIPESDPEAVAMGADAEGLGIGSSGVQWQSPSWGLGGQSPRKRGS